LRRRAITDNGPSLSLDCDQEIQQLPFGLFDLLGKPRISLDITKAGAALSTFEIGNSGTYRPSRISGSAQVNSQGSTVRGELFHIEKRQSVCGAHALHGGQ